MLKKIIAIKNVGKFRNSVASPNPQLARHTVITGSNGQGKTTLCAVLRSLQSGNPDHLAGRKTLGVADPISIELLFESGVTRFDGAAWSASNPNLAIFDAVFIAENIHSGEAVEIDHKRNLYRVILGEEGARLAEKDTRLAAESRAKTTEITTAEKSIQQHIPVGMQLEDFLSLPFISDIDEQIATQKRVVEASQQAADILARNGLIEIQIPRLPVDFLDLLSRTLEDVGREAEQIIADHLVAHGMTQGGDWVAAGLGYVNHGTCPFCGQEIEGLALISAYRDVFSERYAALVAEISIMEASIKQEFSASQNNLVITQEKNKLATEFWSRYCSFDAANVDLPNGILEILQILGETAVTLLDQKARNPLEPISLNEELAEAIRNFQCFEAKSESLNRFIDMVNSLILNKKVQTKETDVGQAEKNLYDYKLSKRATPNQLYP
jgi:wobble nucleotide-excising tRNase